MISACYFLLSCIPLLIFSTSREKLTVSKYTCQVINFFVGLLFLHLLEKIGPKLLYTIFAAFCLAAVAFVKRNVLETKGKSLQEIEIALLPQE